MILYFYQILLYMVAIHTPIQSSFSFLVHLKFSSANAHPCCLTGMPRDIDLELLAAQNKHGRHYLFFFFCKQRKEAALFCKVHLGQRPSNKENRLSLLEDIRSILARFFASGQ